MERWNGKIAIVTGASSGIGWAVVQELVSYGMTVIGLSRRLQEMELKRKEIRPSSDRAAFYPIQCDISSIPSVKAAFEEIEEQFDRAHVLVNNAAGAQYAKLLDKGNEVALANVVDVNVLGAIYCIKEAYRLMQKAMDNGEECHIMSVNSLLGHRIPEHIPESGYNLYPVTKHALTETHNILKRELSEHQKLRLSSISPGLTQTAFNVNFSQADYIEMPLPADELLQPQDVARGVVFILSSPLHVTIKELIMVPSREQY